MLRTKAFYTGTLNWDFDTVWTIAEGEYPTFKSSFADRISDVRPDKLADDIRYDLHGRRQDTITSPGIFIQNGKKVAIGTSALRKPSPDSAPK